MEGRAIVQTVLGSIQPQELGLTMMHEHLLIDLARDGHSPGRTAEERSHWLEGLTLENHYDVRHDSLLYRDNQQLLSVDEAIDEARRFREYGGGCIVDQTSIGLSRDPLALLRISRMSGVHIVMGTGHYVAEYHRPDLASMSVDQIRDELVREALDGVEETGIRPGIIGEVGLTWPVEPAERKVLQACVEAAIATCLPLSIHPGRNPAAPREAIGMVESFGGDPSRTIICHLDRTIDSSAGLVQLAQTGCYLEFDLFGWQEAHYPYAKSTMPNDAQRIERLKDLIKSGFGARLLVSQDIDIKARTRKYGGEGRDHILRRVVPLMRLKGMSPREIDCILVDNPARALTIN